MNAKTSIIKDLKEKGLIEIVKKIKSVKHSRYSGGSSINVTAQGLTETEKESLQSVLNEYEQGSFDGMIDCYNYKKSTKEVNAKFVFLRNEAA